MTEPVIVSAADGPMPPTVDAVKAIRAAGGTSDGTTGAPYGPPS